MSLEMSSEQNIPNDEEACYEAVASQEEVYLEECEEELRAILIFGDSSSSVCLTTSISSHASESNHEQVTREVEELITGDSDDPPLSEEEV